MSSTVDIDGIPVLRVDPSGSAPRGAALWLPPLASPKDSVLPFLRDLAKVGFLALSFDPWEHGERARESPDELSDRVFRSFRRYMWPILGQTTLDGLRVLDWAAATTGTTSFVVGGVSMGGDVAVALAGLDPRITRVAALGASPDWTRPGMTQLEHPDARLDQGEADTYAEWFYEHLDPISHPSRYGRRVFIAFECGSDDTHVPPEAAERFSRTVREAASDDHAAIRVRQHRGLDHHAVCASEKAAENALGALIEGP